MPSAAKIALIAGAFVLALGPGGCMPPPVETMDGWLKAYAAKDTARQLRLTVATDRALLEKALSAPATSRNALALPPRPVDHDILDIVERSEGRQVIEVMMQVRNPLPAASKRVGQAMPGVPETRKLRHRVLVVKSAGEWGVQLDLAGVLARARFAETLLDLVARGQVAAAEGKLQAGVPPVPDDGHAHQGDRLVEEVERRIAAVRARAASTSTAAALTSTAATP